MDLSVVMATVGEFFLWRVLRVESFELAYRTKAFPLGGKVARNAPDEGEMSGSYPLISHLR